jgi:hypothetical protein
MKLTQHIADNAKPQPREYTINDPNITGFRLVI